MQSVAFTRVTSVKPRIVGKKILRFDPGTGEITGETIGDYTSATFETVAFDSFDGLADLIDAARVDPGLQLFLSGVARIPSGKLVAGEGAFDAKGVGGRVAENFSRPAGQPGLLVFDCDPPQPDGAPWDYDALCAVWDALLSGVRFGHVWTPSSSSFLYHEDMEVRGLRGSHTYLVIEDGSDAKRALRVLKDRAILAGYGTGVISDAGTISVKTPFDPALAGASQPIYCGGAWVREGVELTQDLELVVEEGDALDTKMLLTDLDEEEKRQVREITEALVRPLMAEAARIRLARDRDRFVEAARHELGTAATEAEIEARVQDYVQAGLQREGSHELPRARLIVTPDGRSISVGELMDLPDDDPELLSWDGEIVADPLTGWPKAGKLYLTDRDGDRPRMLYSCAGGGRSFTFGTASERSVETWAEMGELHQSLQVASSVYQRLTEERAVEVEAAAVRAEAAASLFDEVLQELLDNFVSVYGNAKQHYDMRNRMNAHLDVLFARYARFSMPRTPNGRPVNPVSEWLCHADCKVHSGVALVDPTRATGFSWNDRSQTLGTVNEYRAREVGLPSLHAARDVEMYLRLTRWLFGPEAWWALSWAATKVREPWQRMTALVSVAPEKGTGRGTWAGILRGCLGEWNCTTIPMEKLLGAEDPTFNGWRVKLLVEVEEGEVQSNDRVTRRGQRRLKEIFDPASKLVGIRRMRQDAVDVPCFMSGFIATNSRGALPLEPGDRRFSVIETLSPPLAAPGGDPELLAWIEETGQTNARREQMLDAVTAYLKADVVIDRRFKPHVALDSEAKRDMVADSRPLTDVAIDAVLHKLGNPPVFDRESLVWAAVALAMRDDEDGRMIAPHGYRSQDVAVRAVSTWLKANARIPQQVPPDKYRNRRVRPVLPEGAQVTVRGVDWRTVYGRVGDDRVSAMSLDDIKLAFGKLVATAEPLQGLARMLADSPGSISLGSDIDDTFAKAQEPGVVAFPAKGQALRPDPEK
jgi:hypothetical protein